MGKAKFEAGNQVHSSLVSTQNNLPLTGTVRLVGERGHVQIDWTDGTMTCERPTSKFMRTVSKLG